MIKLFASMSFKVEGLHHWPNAEGTEEYLKHPHRHLFHFTVKVEQFHNERDIEYLEWRRKLNYVYESSLNKRNEIQDFGAKSCETLAKEVLDFLLAIETLQNRSIIVTVYEDGENGAELYYSPDDITG